MNDLFPVAHDLIRNGRWLPASWLLWTVFLLLMAIFAAATAMLIHHWNEYVLDEKKRRLAKALYLRSSFVLIIGMVVVLLMYSL